jgi:uncharacterized repeat protein (TIGR01451 family)
VADHPSSALKLRRVRLSRCLAILLALLCAPFLPGAACAQIVNGDFSGGATGWTSTAPANSSLTYTGGQLTAVSDNNGGTNSRTHASQTFTAADPGFLSLLLRSYTTTDVGRWDYPMVRIDATFFWFTPAGVLSATETATTVDNDNNGITSVTVRTTLTAGAHTIGAGVTAIDSQLGSGTAIWDDIVFQELTRSPPAQTTPEDTNLVLTGANAPQVATNSGLASMSVTLSVTNGILTLGSTAGITITGGANGTSTVTFTGTPAAINTAMNGLTFVPTPAYNGPAALTFAATGGTLTDTDTIAITVSPVPDYAIAVTKSATPATVDQAGEVISYTVTLQNTGDTAMTGITASDILAQGASNTTLTLSGPVGDGGVAGTLEVGETWTYTAAHSVTQAQIDNGGDLVNTANFGTAQMGASAGSASATTAIGTLSTLAIVKGRTLVKAPGNTHPDAQVGDTILYTYEVENTGYITFTSISVSDVHNGYGTAPVPALPTQSFDAPPLADSTDFVTTDNMWESLAPGDKILFTASYTVVQADLDNLQ